MAAVEAMEHALIQVADVWRGVADSAGLDDLDALRRGIVRHVILSAAHPQALQIMSHEGCRHCHRAS